MVQVKWKAALHGHMGLLLILLNIAALAVRIPLLGRQNSDIFHFIIPWLDFIHEHGGLAALKYDFANYAPAYLHLLVLADALDGLVDRIVWVKLFSIAFDFLAAWMMWRIVRQVSLKRWAPWAAYAAVLFLPTVIFNGALWGQSDMIYTFFLLASLDAALRERPFRTVLLFSIGLAFKLQAAFFAPFLLALLVRGHIPWRYMVVPPVVYTLFALPSALAGRPWLELWTIYLNQVGYYQELTINAPNFYMLVPNSLFTGANAVGLGLTGVAVLWLASAYRGSRTSLDRRLMVMSAALSVALMPFLLPQMHERYFFPADLFTLALAFCCADLRLLAVVFQASSLISYGPYFTGRSLFPLALMAFINAGAIALLLLKVLKALYPGGLPETQPAELPVPGGAATSYPARTNPVRPPPPPPGD